MQNGFLVRDWRAAAEHWVNVLGVGPFFVMEHIGFRECHYHGAPAHIDMSVAIAYTGEQQIELVQQHNATASIYNDFLARHGEGLQHVGALVADLDAALEANDWRHRVVQGGTTVIGQRFAYVDTATQPGAHPGSMLELIETTPKVLAAFEHMKRAAQTWDGSKPIRISR